MSTDTPLYSRFQQGLLGYLPLFSAPFSVVGSSLILYVILSNARRHLKTSYHRLMLGISTMDFFNSMGMVVLGPWAVPEGTPFVVGAHGTITTCEVSGFFLNLLAGTNWYFVSLAVYFLLIVRFEMDQQRFARWIEPVLHLISIVAPIATGIDAIVKDWMNPVDVLPGFCYMYEYPPGCNSSSETECIRGTTYTGAIDGPLILFAWIVVIFCMAMIVTKVRSTEKRLRRYAGGRNNRLQRTRETGIEAILYIVAYFIAYFPLLALMLVGYTTESNQQGRGLYFAFAFLTKLLTPLQGFFNAFIYMRRRFSSLTSNGGTLAFVRRMSISRSISRMFSAGTFSTNTPPEDGVSGNMESSVLNGDGSEEMAPPLPSTSTDVQDGKPRDGESCA